jgi:glutamyl-tRNA reductase
VVSGLDSLILGEPQILGQVKNAYSLACDQKTTCTAVNRLFHHAFRVGKLIRNLTSISEGTVSVSFAAVELSRRIFGDLTGRTVLLAGTGKIGELCARRLVESGVTCLYIANRTPSRAADLAERLTGEAVPFERIIELCARVDILITSVASREPIIRKDTLAPVLERRGGTPLFIIDLGVPRNIDPAVSECGCAHLYDIDDLEDVTLGNRERRMLEAEKAEELIRGEVEAFRSGMREREVAPVIRSLRDRCEDIRREELEKVRNRVDAETLETLDMVTRRIVRKILHRPTVAMRSSGTGADRERMLAAVQELFIERTSDGPRAEGNAAHQTPDNRED